jgi:hypothetical protein
LTVGESIKVITRDLAAADTAIHKFSLRT